MSDKDNVHIYREQGKDGVAGVSFHCPGCNFPHSVPVKPDPRGWDWNGVTDGTTLSPSILVRLTGHWDCSPPGPCKIPNCKGKPHVCHSFVRNGLIEFLSDCTHSLAGRTVPIPPWPLSE